MYSFLSRKIPNGNYPPLIYHLFYLMAAFTFCFLYHHKVVSQSDFYNDEYGAILKVLNLEAIRSIQYRILVPVIFKILSLPFHLPNKAVFFVIMFGFIYSTFIIYYKLLGIYFANKSFNYIAALLIIYPLTWNLVLINSIFFFVDTAVIFFMVLCLYLVVSKKNNWLLLAFFLGALNHYSIGFIIPVFLYLITGSFSKKGTIFYAVAMVVLMVGYFAVMRMLFPNLPETKDDGFVAWYLDAAWRAIADYKKHLLIRDIIINLGGLHFFAFLFVISGMWKKIQNQYVSVFLIVIPYISFALLRFGLRIEEMRNYVPLIPFIIIPAMLYFSKFNNDFLKLNGDILKPVPEIDKK